MNRNGFTLVELLVVVSLLAVALAITGPSLSAWMGGTGSRGAVDEFAAAHSLARAAAVQRGGVAHLRIEAANARFWVEVDTGSVAGVRDTVGVISELSDTGVRLSSDRSQICFDARGLPTTQGGCQLHDATLVFRLAGRADTVRVTPLGRVLR